MRAVSQSPMAMRPKSTHAPRMVPIAAGKWLRHSYNDKVVFSTMPPQTPAWLLLVTNLPGRNPTLRVRIWRALKAAGRGLRRDGAYPLPNRERSRQVLEEQGAEIKAGGGLVQVLSFDAQSDEQNSELVTLFDRTQAGVSEQVRKAHGLHIGVRERTTISSVGRSSILPLATINSLNFQQLFIGHFSVAVCPHSPGP